MTHRKSIIKELESTIRECLICKQKFTPKTVNQKLCSHPCQRKYSFRYYARLTEFDSKPFKNNSQ